MNLYDMMHAGVSGDTSSNQLSTRAKSEAVWLEDSMDVFDLTQEVSSQFNDEVPINHVVGDPFLHAELVSALRTIYDPEISINIYDLGLIYKLDTANLHEIEIFITLTSANCPASEIIPQKITEVARYLYPDRKVKIVLYWTPAWTASRLALDTRALLGL